MRNLWFVGQKGELSLAPSGNPYFESVALFVETYKRSEELTVQTSGSTGKPKQLILSKKQFQASVRQTEKAFNLVTDDIVICTLPIDYIAGKLMLIRAIELGMTAVIFEPDSTPFKNIAKNTKEFFLNNRGKLFCAFVPMQLQRILSNAVSTEIINNGKVLLLGGTGVSTELEAKVRQLSVPVYATYGMTETVTHVAIRRLNGDSPAETFTFLPEIEFGVDELDCLKVKGEVTNNAWVQTTDVVEFTTKNSFKLTGRSDNIINSGGVKLQPEIIEKQLQQIFDGLEISNDFFCIGQPDEQLGQKLILFVEGTIGNSIKQLREAFSKSLSRFNVPKEIYFVEKFERTQSSKLDRNKTAATYFQNA